ncbi:MAG: hypothetical protein Pars92KO_31430 [Parasphingorhabdus sp.]
MTVILIPLSRAACDLCIAAPTIQLLSLGRRKVIHIINLLSRPSTTGIMAPLLELLKVAIGRQVTDMSAIIRTIEIWVGSPPGIPSPVSRLIAAPFQFARFAAILFEQRVKTFCLRLRRLNPGKAGYC